MKAKRGKKTQALVVYQPRQPQVIDVQATVATKRAADPAWAAFAAYITPWFEANFEDPAPRLLREAKGFYRGDKLFRGAVKRGDNRGAKRELKELMGCIN